MNKICIDARMIDCSGIGRYLRNILQAIVAEYDTYLLGDPEKLQRYSCCKNAEIIPASSSIYSIREQIELPFKIPQCDVFWSPHYNIPILPIRAKKRLVTIHDVFHLAFPDTLSPIKRLYSKTVIQKAASLSDAVITVSMFSNQEILRFCSCIPNKIHVIHNGIDTTFFHPITDQKKIKTVKNRYNLPENFILCVGNIKPHKNLERLLKAFENLINKGLTDAKLVIVGNKNNLITADNSAISLLAKSPALRQNVIFTGHVDDKDLPTIYSSAKLFVFPSLYEGFGFPPLEAQACGCPVIVSKAASLPEICGNSAHYIDPYDIASISDGILKNLKDTPYNNSAMKQVEKFSLESFRSQHISLIDTLAS